MRTREIFRYLVAMIIALSTTVNAMAQQRNLKIYFNQYVEGATGAPIMLVTDDNNSYGLPAGLTYSSEGMAWAKEARFFEWVNQDVKDRLIADYVTKNGTVDKKNSHLKISFEDFPYEVNGIQWNVMNDLLSGSITEFFKNYNVTTKCTPVSGSGFSYTEEHWSMNIFQHSTSFNKGSIPWQNGAILKGLKSFELSEKYFVELGLGNLTLWNFGQSELSAKCRTFFKAGWNGQEGSNSNITDSDDNNWAFKITFTMPEIRVRNGRDLFVGDENQIEGYISAHPGAVEVTTNPADPDRFHFEYISNNDIATINQYTGVIRAINAGKASITVKLKRGERDVCSYPYEFSVLDLTPSTPDMSTPEICIVFANGKKGYDVSVGDNNVQIHGQIIKRGDGINVTNNQNGYHYEYTSANTDIATIEQDGTITPKKEGDVDISAVLKYGNTVVSNTYTYMLHVFPNDEGLTWQRDNQYYYYHDSNHRNDWDMGTSWNSSTKAPQTYDWKPTDSLKANTVIAANTWNYANDIDRGNWKQIAWFKTDKYQSWRAICQKIELVAKVPKYSKLTADYRFAANLTLGVPEGTGGCRFGFELKDLGVVTSSDADTKIKDIIWKTNFNNTTYSTPTELKTLIKGTRTTYNSYVEVWGMRSTAPKWEINNKDGDASMSETRYLVAMTHLDKDKKLSAVTSFGYKDIPTYTYYSHIYYHKNTYDGEGYYKDEELYSKGKTGTMKMNQFKVPTRNGYTFLGWSTNPEATVAEYEYQGEFCSYDDVNGGGKGPVHLYAVWRPNTYTVTLDHNDGTGTIEQAYVVYGGNMPLVDTKGNTLNIPTRDGYVFLGYGSPNNYYYSVENGKLVSYRTWPNASDGRITAQWEKIYKITLDADGGTFDGSVSTWPETSILEKNEGSLVLQVRTNQTECAQVYCSNRINIKPGYKLLGWYTEPQSEGDAEHPERPHKGTLVYSIEPGNNFSYHFYAVPNTANAWDANGKWVGTSDLTLYAHYQIIFEVEDDVVTFLDMNPKNCVSGEDLTAALDYAKKNGAKLINTLDMTHPDTGADQLGGEGIMKAFEDAKEETNSIVSPNALILFTSTWPSQRTTNAVTLNKNGGECQNLVVTDRYSMRIPVNFKADKASYARDANVASGDAAKDQAKNSTWGTLCLPYPIQNNTNGVKFYELQSTANNYMEFEEMAQKEVIPANTPVLYIRTDGGVSSMITIKEQNVGVPMNANYTAVNKSYSNADESIRDWEFRGNLKTTVFYGKGYVNPPAGAQILDGDVYYFKQDKFTYLNPKMEKNGKTYQAAKMTLYPYRAYFYRNTEGSYYSSAKVSEYSILVIGEDGATLDITNEIFGDGEGDGKIYDLNGIRVMKPVKGRLYIVNGQKKVYK